MTDDLAAGFFANVCLRLDKVSQIKIIINCPESVPSQTNDWTRRLYFIKGVWRLSALIFFPEQEMRGS